MPNQTVDARFMDRPTLEGPRLVDVVGGLALLALAALLVAVALVIAAG